MPFTPLTLIDAEEVYYGSFNPPSMIVDGILPTGLAVLSGDSKIGKSWMVLWLSLKLAKGEPIWGIETKKRHVVYMALEDRVWRIHKRILGLVDEPPKDLLFTFSCGTIGTELEDQIRQVLKEHPDTDVIFIDTLQKIRDDAVSGANAYAKDYNDLSVLKTIADDHKICICLVHHTRKERNDYDPFDDMSGSKAMQAAADTSLMLRKDTRFGSNATLSITGRDVESRQLRLAMKDNVWELIEVLDQEKIERRAVPSIVFRVAKRILDKGHYIGTISALLEELGETELKPNVASKYLLQHADDVLVPLDIQIMARRTSGAREYMLRIKPPDGHDAHDADDAKKRYELLASWINDAKISLPETASQPSLPSSATQPDQTTDDGFRDITPEDDVPFDLDQESGST